jgi:hypothetical protein
MALVVKEPGWDGYRDDPLGFYADWCSYLAEETSDPKWFKEAYTAYRELAPLRINPNGKLLTQYYAAICLQKLARYTEAMPEARARHKEAIRQFRAILEAKVADAEVKELEKKCRHAIKKSEFALKQLTKQPEAVKIGNSGASQSVKFKQTSVCEAFLDTSVESLFSRWPSPVQNISQDNEPEACFMQLTI